jgi:hypothetical protein
VPNMSDWSSTSAGATFAEPVALDESTTLHHCKSIDLERLSGLTPTVVFERVEFDEPFVSPQDSSAVRALLTTPKRSWKDAVTVNAGEAAHYRQCMAKLRANERRLRATGELERMQQAASARFLAANPLSTTGPVLVDLRMPLSAAANNVFKLEGLESADEFLARAFDKKYQAALPNRRAAEFVLKRTGFADYIHGNLPLVSFDYVRRCVESGTRADLTVRTPASSIVDIRAKRRCRYRLSSAPTCQSCDRRRCRARDRPTTPSCRPTAAFISSTPSSRSSCNPGIVSRCVVCSNACNSPLLTITFLCLLLVFLVV